MNDDINKKMGLNFEEEGTSKPEENVVNKKDELNEKLEEENTLKEKTEPIQNPANENEYILPKEEVIVDKIVESPDIQSKRFKNNNKIKKDTVKSTKKEKVPRRIIRYLLIGIWWTFILVLAIIFGSESIWRFGNKFSDFIKSAKASEISGNFYDISEAIKNFFISVAYVFEAILFVFLIIYSALMTFKNYKPWIIYRKSTEHYRYQDRIIKAKIKIAHLQKELRNNGIETKLKFVTIEQDEHFLPTNNGKEVRAKQYYSDLKKEINHLLNKQKKVNEVVKEVKNEISNNTK